MCHASLGTCTLLHGGFQWGLHVTYMADGSRFTVDDALAQLPDAMSASGRGLWDLRNLAIMPAFLDALICRLPTVPPQGVWEGSVTLDLTENRLGPVADWKPLVTALKLRSWLCVRLGSETMPPRVIEALVASDMLRLWDSQLFVDRPWENPCNTDITSSDFTYPDHTQIDESLAIVQSIIDCIAAHVIWIFVQNYA